MNKNYNEFRHLRTIGILGGMTSQATIEYYQAINKAINNLYGGYESAEIVIVSVNFGNIERFVRNQKWEVAREYLISKALKAKAAGADLLVCASNTMHKVLEGINEIIDIPFIHITSPIIAKATEHKLTRLGLIGTIPVMKDDFISSWLIDSGIDVHVPHHEQMEIIDRILFDETSKGIVREESKLFMKRVIEELIDQGSQGIVLACTELFMLVNENDYHSTMILDTTKLHVEAIVREATKGIKEISER